MLRQLQDLRLGALHDVHSHAFHKKLLYLEPVLYFSGAPHKMGDNASQVPREILGRIQQHTAVRELSGQDMQTKGYETL